MPRVTNKRSMSKAAENESCSTALPPDMQSLPSSPANETTSSGASTTPSSGSSTRSAYQDRVRNLLDQTRELTDAEHLTVLFFQGLGTGPLEPERIRRSRHAAGCNCIDCWNAGLRYGEYLKQKRLNEL